MEKSQETAFSQTLGVLCAAAGPSRLWIVLVLSRGGLLVLELTHILDQSHFRVSWHLKLITKQGLIDCFQEGAYFFE
jgi:DNA-binding transcriptional ArsR family regulator